MPRFEPAPSAVTAPFWEATKERKLLLQWCDSCSQPIYYPRWACPRCLGESLSWRESAGVGVIYAFNVMHQPANPMMADQVPYVIALVDLEEGVRMVTNVVDVDPGEVKVGMAVRVRWENLSDGRHLPLFAPA